MSVPTATPTEPHGPVGRLLERVTGTVALVGGFALVAVMVIESTSVIGRGLATVFGGMLPRWVGSIAGDTEIVEVGCAAAIFAFLPYCQLMRGNVLVDFFTKGLPLRARSFLDLLANLLFLVLALAITWQLQHGAIDKWRYGDTTTVLRIPEAWPYSLSLLSAWLLVVTTAYTVARSADEILRNRAVGPQASGEH